MFTELIWSLVTMGAFDPRHIFLAFVLLTAISCSENPKRVVERWTDGTPKVLKNYYHRDSSHYQLITYYEEGTIKELTHFEGAKKNGWNITYFESGNVKDSTFLENNIPLSSSKHFHGNGNLRAEGSYEEGKRDGNWIFYDSLGILNEITFYSFGVMNGRTSTFNDKGWLTKEVYRFSEGMIKEIINYQDSLKHGDYELFDINGNYKQAGKFNRGNRKGTRWITYHSSGEKFREVEYTSEDEWNSLLVNLWNPEGEQTVKNGNGYFRFNNYINCNGKQIIDSQTTLFYTDGKQSNKRVMARQDCH